MSMIEADFDTFSRYVDSIDTSCGYVEISASPRHVMPFDPRQPYDLPPLPPARELETKAVLKLCIDARSNLAELKQAGALIPNPAILINTIPVLEAQASSAIENIVTTSDRLFRFAGHPEERSIDPATKEALRYGTALATGFRSIERHPLSTRTAVEICSIIKGVDMDVRRTPGTALVNDADGRIVYTPPDGEERIRGLLANWETFAHDPALDLDPLVKLAVLHYQFEAIHPFTDGNGRTGRILNVLFLKDARLLDLPILYLSRYILHNRSQYYALLQGVTVDDHWEPWILFMLSGIRETAHWTTAKIASMRLLMDAAAEAIRRAAPSIYSRDLVDLLFSQPYARISNVVEAGLAQRQTASSHLRKLVEIGVLRDIKVGRERLFVHPALIRLLTTESNEITPYAPAFANPPPGAE